MDYEGADMDFHFTNQIAQLSLSNGSYLTSKRIFESSNVESISQSKYHFELELNCDPVCEQEFLELKELEFPENTIISASLLNFDFPYADLVEVEKVNKQMKYSFSIALIREHWQHDISLNKFISTFIRTLRRNNLNAELELEESFAYYLQVSFVIPPTSTLQHRIKMASRKIADTQLQVLLELGEQ